jgi:hypothetical protein
VRTWEYKKISLNDTPHKRDDIDLLCEAGEEGWELVAIVANSVAYLKREVDSPNTRKVKLRSPSPTTKPKQAETIVGPG